VGAQDSWFPQFPKVPVSVASVASVLVLVGVLALVGVLVLVLRVLVLLLVVAEGSVGLTPRAGSSASAGMLYVWLSSKFCWRGWEFRPGFRWFSGAWCPVMPWEGSPVVRWFLALGGDVLCLPGAGLSFTLVG
jgi:hypothetical protein